MAKSNFIVRGGADFSSIKKEMDKTQRALSNFQSSVSSTMKKIGVILGSLAIGKLVKDSTKIAMSVESAVDNINRNMGSAAKTFQNFVNMQSQALGMARADAYKYGSTFSNLLSSFTTSTKETADQTQELMKAAAIIASKTGRTYDDVADRIRSGLLGSTEAIEDLGVYTNISMIESTNAFKKFAGDKSWTQLNYQTQQQIRLAAILEQTYTKYGDTLADTTQTRQAQLVASLKNVQLSLGQAFLPIYNAVLPALTAMANAIGRVVNVIAQFTTAIFGSAKNAQTQTKAIQGQVSGMQNLGDATTNAGKAAKKAAKDAQGALASFDEINSLSKGSSSAGDSGVGTSGAGAVSVPPMDTGGFASATVEVSEKVKKMADTIKKAFEDISNTLKKNKNQIVSSLAGIGAGIGTYLIGTHWKDLMQIVPKAMGVVSKALSSINAPILAVAALIGLFVKAIVELWQENKEFRDNVIKAWNGIKETFKNIWDTILKPIFKAFVNMLLDIYNNGIKPLWTRWKEFVKQLVMLMTDLWNGMKPVVDWIVKTFGPIIVDIFKWAFNEIKKVVLLIIDIVSNILDAFSGVISGVRQIFKGLIDFVAGVFTGDWSRAWNGIKNIFAGVKTAISSVWNGIKEIFGNILNYISSTFKNAWSTAWNAVKSIFSNVFNSLKGIASNAWNGIKSVFGGVRSFFSGVSNGIKSTFSSIPAWFKTTFTNAWNNVKKVFSSGGKIFSGIKEGIDSAFRTVVNKLISGINTLISVPFNKINSMLNKIRSVSVFGMMPFQGLWGENPLSIPKIPYLARGGIIDRPTLAMVGEAGKEMVVPLENTSFVDKLAGALGSAVLSAMQFSNSREQTSGDVILQIDGTTLGRVIKPYLDREQERVGTRLILKTT